MTNHLKTTILDKLYTKRASISDMFGTGPTEFGRISSFSSCKNDLHKKDLLGSRRRLNDSWSQAVAETAAAVSAVTQLNCRFQPPSTISIGPLFSPKWLDNSKSKKYKSTTRPPSFLYLISSTRNGELLGRGESYATTSGVCVPGGSLAIGLLWGQSWSQGAHRNPRISWKWEDAEFLLPSLVFFEKWETPDFKSLLGNLKSCFHSQLKAEMLLRIMLLSTCPPKKFVQKAAWTKAIQIQNLETPNLARSNQLWIPWRRLHYQRLRRFSRCPLRFFRTKCLFGPREMLQLKVFEDGSLGSAPVWFDHLKVSVFKAGISWVRQSSWRIFIVSCCWNIHLSLIQLWFKILGME